MRSTVTSRESAAIEIEGARTVRVPDRARVERAIEKLRSRYLLGQAIQGVEADLDQEIYAAFATIGAPDHAATLATLAATYSMRAQLLKKLDTIRELVYSDARAALERDPAATSLAEVLLTYPGIEASFYYRVANALLALGAPILPRMITEIARKNTGIDIHPAAVIGRGFFIDHGTGVVIGETARIGDQVTLYHGVTLGTLAFERDEQGRLVRGTRRHPTLEDGVTVYSNATILGRDTVIGRGSVIGAGATVTSSLPAYSKVVKRV